ncbi:MAG: Radical SAM superfamily enzyme [Candidatus Methanohalarchaeum thermophilum]|uniref:Radical SAM superfamily enzyme n=1 Tax=Methanohalarchaeum thermophilum TaxID=1903181 RepID=A0A1Q6DTT3_METT1|nr:MAG: Radical SAM superfamily enzyme [Candidatus Methanohalarchaeum thermophilum]
MTDVLLAKSPVKDPVADTHPWASPPLIPLYAASVLREKGYKTSFIDFNVAGGFKRKRLERILEKEKPRVVGVFTGTEEYLNALDITKYIKGKNSEIKTFLSGPHPTAMYNEVLKQPTVDFCVRGEGEYAILELVDAINNKSTSEYTEIKGVALKKNGDLISNPPNPPQKNTELPYPSRDLAPMKFYDFPGIVRTAWGGCPNNCSFCNVPTYRGRDYFARDPIDILKEIERLLFSYQHIRVIKFMDDTFSIDKDKLYELTDGLKKISPPFGWKWTFTTRVDKLTKKMAKEVSEAGCSTILVGAESGSQRILDSINKGIQKNEILEAVKKVINEGMDINVTFMYPLPEDTAETIKETINFMKKLKDLGANLILDFTTPYPGTPLYENSEELGIKILADSWEEYDAKHLLITSRYLDEKNLKKHFKKLVSEVGLNKMI